MLYNTYKIDSATDIQLHIFVDASEKAYAAVGYLRITHENHIACSMVGAKTRVAPLKPLSIPRLELEAAVLGSRLARTIEKSHSIKIKKRVFWTDSKTVICWLRSDQRKYKQFVAFRVGEILEITALEEWRWIPTKENVADEATKWTIVPDVKYESRWFCGAQFLTQSDVKWPIDTSLNALNNVTEEQRINTHVTIVNHSLIDIARFSNWNRLMRTQAYIFRFINKVRAHQA